MRRLSRRPKLLPCYSEGDVAPADLLPALRRVERQCGREVNVKRYSQREFRDKMRDVDHFLKSVVKGKLVSLIGSPDELKKLLAEHEVHSHSTSNSLCG